MKYVLDLNGCLFAVMLKLLIFIQIHILSESHIALASFTFLNVLVEPSSALRHLIREMTIEIALDNLTHSDYNRNETQNLN